MHLYRITTLFLGKDLDEEAILGYLVAATPEEVADLINERIRLGDWFGDSSEDDPDEQKWRDEVRQAVIAFQGDFHADYAGEFYDQKYGWDDLGEITSEQEEMLRKLGILEVKVSCYWKPEN